MFDPVTMIFLVIILAISIWLHEYAHAYTSYKLGDPTPKLQNRLTPNPIAHIDIMWFILIFLIHFWRWKPVQVNPSSYKNPLTDELKVALAWPLTNLVLWLFWILFVFVFWKFVFMFANPQELANAIGGSYSNYLISFWILFAIVNFNLAIFNMIPIPPLDWFRLVKIYNTNLAAAMKRNEIILFVWLVFFLITFWWWIISWVSNFILNILFPIFSNIFY